MKLRVENTGYGDAKRIMDGDNLVGMAIKYTSGFWAAHSPEDTRLTAAHHKTPAAVRKWFEVSKEPRP